jgi:uncharacterized protein (DUF1684 family)
MIIKSRRIFGVLVVALIFAGCSERNPAKQIVSSSKDPILQERIAKDAAFKSGSDSPIPELARSGFQGLSYYPLELSFRFQVKLHRYAGPKSIRIATNTGEIRSGLVYGYFEFRVGVQACKLQAYRLEDASGRGPSLFIPFRDATTGKETYSAGRYVELAENTSGVYDLDFNRAYNPYCVYNSEYSCPLPPVENTLTVPVRAGEKIFHAGH